MYEQTHINSILLFDYNTSVLQYIIHPQLNEKRSKLNDIRSMQALRRYTKEAEEKEQQRLADLTSSKDIDAILDSDALAREVITSEIQEEQYEAGIRSKVDELRAYTKDLLDSEQDLVLNTTRKILEDNPDPNLNTVYDEVLSGIQQSRKDKLSNATFGVMGNTIALEQARQFGLIAREDEKRELEAREEALALGYCSEEGLDDFFKEPTDAAGNRMFRSIVRSILEKRPPSVADTVEAEPVAADDEELDEDEEDDLNEDEGAYNQQTESDTAIIGTRKSIYFQDEEAKKKWSLTPSEKVEAFRLLKEWRAVYNERNQALKEEKRPVNKIKPLFLYKEQTEQTKEWQKEEVNKALRRQLDSDDDVEKASNDLLIKELMEGGYTKERSLRLVDKLIEKATDKIIRDALLDMKTTLMEQEDTKEKVKTKELPKKPLFVDMKQVLSRDDEDDVVRPPQKQLKRQDTSQIVQPPPIQTSTYTPEDEDEYDLPSAVARPASEFFATPTDLSINPNRTTTTSELLGSYEDQLFEKLASKTGVKSEEEKAEFKRNLDEINALRSKILSDVEDERLARERAGKSGVDVSSLLEEDGDADSIEKLLSKRPVVPSQDSQTSTSPAAKHEIIESSGNLVEMGDPDNNDIITARYRALFGVDGNADEEDEYRKFLMEEEELRKNAENKTFVEILSDVDPANITDVDKYADEVISKLKPRPQPTDAEDEYYEEIPLEDLDSEISRLDSAFEQEENQEDFDPFPVDGKQELPSWLEKEAESQGMRRKESKRDNKLDKERQREIEERQKMADAYIERTNKGKIDLAEVLDRPYFGSMDEPDDYKKRSYAMSNYLERKDELMKYTTLTLEDLVNFAAWKQDPAISGANKELRQVQNPFSEFGAIFRLEGVVADLIGMNAKSWPKVAEKFGYTIQSEEDIRKASLYSPAKAIRVVFGWTDDVIEVDEIVKAYRSEFNDAYNQWLEHDRTFVYPNDPTRRNNSGKKKTTVTAAATPKSTARRPSKDEVYETYSLAWNKLARLKNKDPPTTDQIIKGVSLRDWELAVPQVFGWTEYNAEEVYNLVVEYDTILQADLKILYQKYKSDSDNSFDNNNDSSAAPLPPVERPKPSKEEINTSYAIAWNKLALQMGKTTPTKEQVMEGVKLRDWEVCVKDVFGWNEHSKQEIHNIVVEYDKILQEDLKTLYSNYGIDHSNKFARKYPDVTLKRGIIEWLDKLDSVDMPYVIMSHLGSSQIDAILDVMGLADYFPPEMRISHEEHYSDEISELLGGILRLEKHPEKCVFFDNTPGAAETAHEVLAKCISFVNQYPKYELMAADWVVGGVEELALSKIRTLFSEREDDIPLVEAEAQGILKKRPAATKTSYKFD
eukprot:scaffold29424_cov54-Cyclotella_meneghiniana.AAC.6